ncbi:MAG: phosphopantothenoylcysteine decarboxylase [Candidatus Firestonebacteria bacterium]
MKNKNILITSGPTRGIIDDIRYITNSSSGELGVAIANESLFRSANVCFIYGKGSLLPQIQTKRLQLIEVRTVNDLISVLKKELKTVNFDVIIHSMAVLDYEPKRLYKGKISSAQNELRITLTKTPKVVNMFKEISPQSFLVSFKLESNISKRELTKRAYNSLLRTKSDLVVANDFKNVLSDSHKAFIVDSSGIIKAEFNSKKQIAKGLFDIIEYQI